MLARNKRWYNRSILPCDRNKCLCLKHEYVLRSHDKIGQLDHRFWSPDSYLRHWCHHINIRFNVSTCPYYGSYDFFIGNIKTTMLKMSKVVSFWPVSDFFKHFFNITKGVFLIYLTCFRKIHLAKIDKIAKLVCI